MIFFILEVNEALLKLLFSFKFSFDELCVRADDIFDLFLEFDSLIHVYFLFFLSFFLQIEKPKQILSQRLYFQHKVNVAIVDIHFFYLFYDRGVFELFFCNEAFHDK